MSDAADKLGGANDAEILLQLGKPKFDRLRNVIVAVKLGANAVVEHRSKVHKTAAENEKLKEKNKTLSASLDKAKEGSVLKRLEDAKLRQDYEAALKTLDSIPPEVIRFYENRTQEPVMRHDK